jgi:ATP-dependent RNA helicase DDX27
MALDDFIMTIDSDNEDLSPPKVLKSATRRSRSVDLEDAQLNTEFTFDFAGESYVDIMDESNLRDLVKSGSRPVSKFEGDV